MHRMQQRVVGRVARWWRWTTTSTFVVGLLSLAWFLFRTGTKPSRAAYPCQRVAATNAGTWLTLYFLPILSITGFVGEKRSWRRRLATVVVVAAASIAAAWFTNGPGLFGSAAEGPIDLILEERLALGAPASDLFVVRGTSGNDNDVAALIGLMAEHGAHFYRSAETGETSGPDGFVGSNDVVLLKINCQWDQRGGTNTDLLKAVIGAIVDHPDGFAGEVIVADNGQAQYGTRGNGGSMDWSWNNAEERSQSVQDVVDSYAAEHAVSAVLWDPITDRRVAEYSEGDPEDGYVLVDPPSPTTGAIVAYPKFHTEYGTCVSFRRGIWDPSRGTYDADRLVLINLPVLKPHTIFGVTGCIKHYMGVTSDALTRVAGARAHESVGTGGMGTEIAGTRFPTLNILDAIWASLTPGVGPQVRYGDATKVGVIAASTDPVALDYWGAKYILTQGARATGTRNTDSLDPDSQRSFATWLRLSMDELAAAGHRVTVDEARMNVFVREIAGS